MTQKPVNLKLYFEVQGIVRPQSTLLPTCPENAYDEVYPKLYLGSAKIVKNQEVLKSLGITHIMNTSMGPRYNQVNTSNEYYKEFGIDFYGVPAIDQPYFQILPFLKDAVAFIDHALSSKGTVYVHCQQGVSRSATVVLAFLMLTKDMDLLTAAKYLRSKREVSPNDGFLKQLCELQEEIESSKSGSLQGGI